MEGIEHIYCKRIGSTKLLIDLVYSPDDGGYYFEKIIFFSDGTCKEYQSKGLYGTRIAALKNQDIVEWERI